MLSAAWGIPTLIRLIGFPVVFSLDKGAALRYFLPVVLILFEFLPCAALVVVTARMILIIRKISRQMDVLTSQLRFNHATVAGRIQTNGFSKVKVIGFVVAVFLVCFAASLFSSFCDIYPHQCSTPDFVWLLRRLCLVTNSAANPIAYAFLKSDIKKELKKILCKNG